MARTAVATTKDEEEIKIGESHSLAEQAAGNTDVQFEDYGADAGAGLENLGLDEKSVPFLNILQPGSPQINPHKPEVYIEGAKMGMLFNTATKEVYDPIIGIEMLAVYREQSYIEWKPFDQGGGFRGLHDPSSAIIRKLEAESKTRGFGKLSWNNPERDNEAVELVKTFNVGIVYGAPNLDPYNMRRAILSISLTKIPAYRALMASLDDIRVPGRDGPSKTPLWAHRLRLSTVYTSNAKGEFFIYKYEFAEQGPIAASRIPMTSPYYIEARDFRKQWEAKEIKADYANFAESQAGEAASAAGAGGDDADLPF